MRRSLLLEKGDKQSRLSFFDKGLCCLMSLMASLKDFSCNFLKRKFRASLTSLSSSLPLCFDLRFVMNFMAKTIECTNFVHFENLLTSLRHSPFEVSIVTFVSSMLPREFLRCLSGSLRKAGNFNQKTLRSQAGNPRETTSAVLSPLMCYRLVEIKVSRIVYIAHILNWKKNRLQQEG